MAAAAAAADADARGITSIGLEDLPDDVLVQILRRLDGPALASAGCVSSRLRLLSALPSIWQDLCLSTWPTMSLLPSLPSSPRTFFSRAFPFPTAGGTAVGEVVADVLVSVVSLYHRGVLVFSRIFETETKSPWFGYTSFRIDALERHEGHLRLDQPFSPADLELSWLVMDRAAKRVVDVSSRRPVAVDPHWFSGEVQVKFATVAGDCRAAAVASVTCGGHEVRELMMSVEDTDGVYLRGRESLAILGEMMAGGRRGNGMGRLAEEAREKYGEFVGIKKGTKEMTVKREEETPEILWTAAAVSVLCSVCALPVYWWLRGQ
ncbi:putative F-box protein [Apostasia shenzhenica]|uniref:Putative F-box protein n=1 Tax=Apostasia shenzhenica TaxID=1088818 RepID=A0A2I0A7Z7_9ASPA|nr:putative F-box protein [Apostasia shenzhenica]